MSKKKSILVATIGTRDLAFLLSSGEWRNVGNNQAEANSKTDRMLVQEDVGKVNTSLRDITKFFLEFWDEYSDRLRPIIIGQLLQDKSDDLEKIYLLGTDQLESINFRSEDTIYSAKLIECWIKKHLNIPVEVILQGQEGFNPSNFDQMFQWWKDTWNHITTDVQEDLPIILCLKGGVGQSSEASRITALSRFAENAIFYDFRIDKERNLLGKASLYGNPSLGANYLWDRRQKEALALLNRFDYEAVDLILKPYYSQDLHIEKLLEAAKYWNNCKFKEFADVLGERGKERSQQWWWTGYEAAYLATIRLEQNNTVETLFHSFRAIEGSITLWAEWQYPQHIDPNNGSPQIKYSILEVLPDYLNDKRQKDMLSTLKETGKGKLGLYSFALYDLMRKSRPEWSDNPHIKFVWDTASSKRNKLFHRLLGLQKEEVFDAWGTSDLIAWKERILGCLNFLTKMQFRSISEPSLMAKVHEEIQEAIATYQP